MLSGGEQALTALALIFAVFLTNPAPICVLDEVDAPLDDHNVERFCDLLDEMTRSTDTRFVIITHNPITMARMNRLFGVTMAERGVSHWSRSISTSRCGSARPAKPLSCGGIAGSREKNFEFSGNHGTNRGGRRYSRVVSVGRLPPPPE